ncbi:hypothetical protein [Helicobacter mesocricetorum]|uniref:hypothetical protein n=1 Tax=Helicobacter mesocricetorum TaxID=87012 RepID=UPI000CF1C3C1|nr:hypothetical protein [Helicobacter mesocricetorum]
MNLKKLIRHLLATVVVGIEIDNRFCYITTKFYRRSKIVEVQTRSFKTIPGELPMSAVRYINAIRFKKPFTYISSLSTSIIQGVMNTTNEDDFIKYGVNISDVESKRIDDWFVYCSKEGIAETKKQFFKIGVDFVISPFILLHSLIKDDIEDSCNLYILFQKSNITMIVARGANEVLFGAYYILESKIDLGTNAPKKRLNEDLDDDEEEPDVTNDINQELANLGDLDLENESDSDEELIEFLKDETEDSPEENTSNNYQETFDDFSRVSYAAKFIQSAIGEFYNNEIYQSDFITQIILFNPHKIDEEVLKHISNTTMLDLDIRSCNVSEALSDLGYESYKFFEKKEMV